MSGERGANGDVRGFAVADFADHDDVGILADDVAETGSEREPDLRVDVNLIDPIHLIFDRVLDGDDLPVVCVDAFERTIKRCGLAASGWSGYQKYPVGERGEMLHAVEHGGGKAEALEFVAVGAAAVQQAHDNAFAMKRGKSGDAQVHFAAQNLQLNP